MLRSSATSLALWLLVAWTGTPVVGQDEVSEVVQDLLARGERHRGAGRDSKAIAAFEEALELDPAAIPAYVALGAIYLTRGEPEKSYDLFTTGLEHDPEREELLFDAAVVARRLGRLEAALSHVDRALELSRRNATYHALKSAVLRDQGRAEDALGPQLEAVRLDPGNADQHYRLGNLYFSLRRLDEAAEAFQKAIERAPQLLQAHANLGFTLYEAGRFDEAIEAYAEALTPIEEALASGRTVDPGFARVYENLGTIYSQKLDDEAALDAYTKALRLDPDNAQLHYIRGQIFYRQSRYDEAYDAYERALSQDQEFPLACLHMGTIDLQRGRLQKAVGHLETALAGLSSVSRRRTLLKLGNAYVELGRRGDARQAFSEVVEADPENLEALVALGRLAASDGDHGMARAFLENALEVDPEHVEVALDLASLAHASGDLDRERELYETVLENDPGNPNLWPVEINLARVLMEQGFPVSARRLFGPVIERMDLLRAEGMPSRDCHQLTTAYALILTSEGDLSLARRHLSDVIGEDPNFSPARDAIAVLDALDGDTEMAVATLRSSLELHLGKPSEPFARANLGQALWLAERRAEARDEMESALAGLGEGHLSYRLSWLLLLAEIYLVDGDSRKALEGFQTVVDQCTSLSGGTAVASSAEHLHVVLGATPGSGTLCQRARRYLGATLVRTAFTELQEATGETAERTARDVRQQADQALELPLGDDERAVAHFVRGTARLFLGAYQGAHEDLVQALDELPPDLLAKAHNNLGVALYRLGELDGARRELEAARAAKVTAALLNLGILYDDRGGDGRQALALYEDYLARDGRRRQEVETWIEQLRKVYE